MLVIIEWFILQVLGDERAVLVELENATTVTRPVADDLRITRV